jgi:hypothetical protein
MLSMRPLSMAEIGVARQIFAESLDLGPVRVLRDSPASLFAPVALLNSVHLKSSWGHVDGDDGGTLTGRGLRTLIHELGHVWQYQNGGLAYIPRSLTAQLVAWLKTGSRGGAYKWQEALREGTPWAMWNPEQQAQAIEDYATALRRQDAPFDARTVELLQPYIDKVRRGEGAPQF